MKLVLKVIIVVIIVVALIEVVGRNSPAGTPKPPLDYSKPIFTTDYAIICPVGLFLDVRADHGPEAINDLFTSVLNLKEKEKTLGCDEWHGGIRVGAVRMMPPRDHYIQVNDAFFTMESHLTNEISATPSSPSN
jgi:hypothetical protein